MTKVTRIIECFKRAAPDWNGPLTPEESVRCMLEVIGRLTKKDNGGFLSHKGNKEWL